MHDDADSAVLTRWDAWFSDENLRDDPRILEARHSHTAEDAGDTFLARGAGLILDLACGVGRDLHYLRSRGLSVVGVDASLHGLRAARRRGPWQVSSDLVAVDARWLPFRDSTFGGVHCFGLLHEFTGDRWEQDVGRVMAEIGRVLTIEGLLVLAVLAGDPVEGLPKVQLFSRGMFDDATKGWRPVEVTSRDDVGCTNVSDYHVWYGVFEKCEDVA